MAKTSERRVWAHYLSLPLVKSVTKNLGLILIGSALCAVAINGILVPYGFLSGGFVGIALIIHHLVPTAHVGLLYFILNIPLFALGWKFVGHRFLLYSITGMIIFSACVEWIRLPLPTMENKILAALLAGMINGAGAGIILRSMGSAGGGDILSVIFLRRFSIRIGTTILIFNTGVLAIAALLLSLEGALYTLVFMYVTSHMVNVVVMGLSQRKVVIIISDQSETICKRMQDEIHLGVTLLQGRGGYSKKDEQVLYAVVAFKELPRLKELIRGEDPAAFVVVTETLEVMGTRMDNQPHW